MTWASGFSSLGQAGCRQPGWQGGWSMALGLPGDRLYFLPAMKSQRRAAIMSILKRTRVHSQEQLRDLLHAEGIDVTQATLSRDMRELRLAKLADPAGGS